MTSEKPGIDHITFKPLTPETWIDFTLLFSEHGPQQGCWCMYWRETRVEYHRRFGDGNQQAMKAIIQTGNIPGLLAYLEGRAIAWCSIARREEFPALDRSKTLKKVDNVPVWSIVCFFVSRPYRRKGLLLQLIRAALTYARECEAKIVEAYPLKSEIVKDLPYERYMGIESILAGVGFKEVARRSDRRLVMRYYIE